FSPIGALAGGFLADLLRKRDARLPLILPIVGGLGAIPLMITSVMVSSGPLAIFIYGLGFMVASLHFATAHSLIQSTSPLRLRGLAWSVLVVTTALIGGGLGPSLVGMLSDVLAPRFGEDSLRYAMALATLGIVPGIISAGLAARTLRQDLAAAEATDPA
ncbi:MAG: transporter, partial [Caulobacteraceae bacterium]|nr:transporter [Caulobacteraceae bacterium]